MSMKVDLVDVKAFYAARRVNARRLHGNESVEVYERYIQALDDEEDEVLRGMRAAPKGVRGRKIAQVECSGENI